MFITEAAAYAVCGLVWPDLTYREDAALFFLSVLSRSLLPPLILGCRKLYRKHIYPGPDSRAVKCLLLIPIPALLCAVMLLYFPYINRNQPAGLFALCMTGLTAALAYIMALAARFAKERRMRERLADADRHMEMTKDHIKELDAAFLSVSGTIHDMALHLEHLTTPENENYVSAVRNRLRLQPGDTGNHDIDAIISRKRDKLPDGAELSVTGTLPPFIPWLDAPDIVSLLGNALDNAVEAVERLPAGACKTISVSFYYNGPCLIIRITNPYEERTKRGRGQNNAGHGRGLFNMRSVTERYNGHLYIKTSAGTFTVTAFLQGGE